MLQDQRKFSMEKLFQGDFLWRVWALGMVVLVMIYLLSRFHMSSGINDFVYSVSFSPDGKQVLTGFNQSVVLWDIKSGGIIRTFHPGCAVSSVAFSPDGQRVAVGGVITKHGGGSWRRGYTAGLVSVWGLDSRSRIITISDLHVVNSVVFSPDGKNILIGAGSGEDAPVVVWDVEKNTEVCKFEPDTIHSLAFSSDGKLVLTGCAQGVAGIWDATEWRPISRLPHNSAINAVSFSPDERWYLTGAADGNAILWDDFYNQKFIAHHDSSVSSVAFSPDSKWFLTGSTDKTAKIWDTKTGRTICTYQLDAPVTSVAVSPNGKQVLIGTRSRNAVLYDSVTGGKVRTFVHHNSTDE